MTSRVGSGTRVRMSWPIDGLRLTPRTDDDRRGDERIDRRTDERIDGRSGERIDRVDDGEPA